MDLQPAKGFRETGRHFVREARNDDFEPHSLRAAPASAAGWLNKNTNTRNGLVARLRAAKRIA